MTIVNSKPKFILILVMSIFFLFSLTSCGSKPEPVKYNVGGVIFELTYQYTGFGTSRTTAKAINDNSFIVRIQQTDKRYDKYPSLEIQLAPNEKIDLNLNWQYTRVLSEDGSKVLGVI